MKNLRDSIKASGYDSEEAYFYKREQELIQKMRESNAKQPTLTLLTGGKANELQSDPRTTNRATKKAA